MPVRSATHQNSAQGAVGAGRVVLWRGGGLWVSRGTGRVQPHAHHAIQITLSPEQPICMRSVEAADWQLTQASVVMPGCPHQFDGCGQDVVMVFVEPETTAGRMLVARYGHVPLTTLDDVTATAPKARGLLDGLAAQAGDDVLIAGARAIVELLVGGIPEATLVDERIARAIDWMRDRLGAPITLAQAAAAVHLSPGRFRHLFVAQTGISFRAYLLWARVNTAVVTAMAGRTWTQAAQHAGFADSAHLTRTCRRMFGIAPTMLGREEDRHGARSR